MLSFLVRRLATIIPTLFFVSMLIFGLQQLLPGDPAVVLAGEDRDPNVVAYLHDKLHLDEPLPVRYLYWLGGVLHGDLGESLRMQKPVLALILEKLPVTIELAVPGDADRARDRHSRRHRVGGRQGHRVGLRGERHRAVGPVDAQLLARHPDDPALLGDAGLAAGFGLREPVRGPARQPRGDDHAGVRARQRDRRGADAPHAQRDAAGAVVRLRAHRARQGPGRARGRAQARAAQRADADHHAGRAGVRRAALAARC